MYSKCLPYFCLDVQIRKGGYIDRSRGASEDRVTRLPEYLKDSVQFVTRVSGKLHNFFTFWPLTVQVFLCWWSVINCLWWCYISKFHNVLWDCQFWHHSILLLLSEFIHIFVFLCIELSKEVWSFEVVNLYVSSVLPQYWMFDYYSGRSRISRRARASTS